MAGSSSSKSLQREIQEDLQAAFDKYKASINSESPVEHSQAVVTFGGTIDELREKYVDHENHVRQFDYHVQCLRDDVLRFHLEAIQQTFRRIMNRLQIYRLQIPPQNPPQNQIPLRKGTRRNRPPSDLPQNLRRGTRRNRPPSDLLKLVHMQKYRR